MAVVDGHVEAPEGETFGKVLRSVRLRLGLSQGQVAQKVGLDRSYVNRLEAGERGAPSAHAIVALATALDLDEPDTDRLLLSGGLPVKALVDLGLGDPTLLALARRLTDPRLSEGSRTALRATVDATLAHWGNPAGAVALGVAGQLPRPGTGRPAGRSRPPAAGTARR